MKIYKLTTQTNTTHKGFVWTPGKWEGPLDGQQELCSSSWFHYYTDPLLAVLLNPIHANIDNPKLWESEARGTFQSDRGLKGGATEMRTIKEIPVPNVTLAKRIAFGILCALEVYDDPEFVSWANAWLDGSDRSEASARAAEYAADAADAAEYAADAAEYAAEYAAARAAAYAAARATRAAADDERAARAKRAAADASARAARATRAAADASARAAEYAARADGSIDLIKLAHKAMTYN